MAEFIFTPPAGLGDKVAFPTAPASEEEARQQLMTLFNQVKDHMNTSIKINSGVKGDNWWIKDEATGIIRQGGTASITFNNTDVANVTVNFHKAFTTKACTVIAIEKSNNITTTGMFNIACSGNYTTSFSAQACVLNQTPRTGTVTFCWEATGY